VRVPLVILGVIAAAALASMPRSAPIGGPRRDSAAIAASSSSGDLTGR